MFVLFVPFLVIFSTLSSNPEAKEDMALISAGEFLMGTPGNEAEEMWEKCNKVSPGCLWDWFKAETPQHKVYLNAFLIDKYEVTNANYRKCVQAQICKSLPDTKLYDDGKLANHPVVFSSWSMAKSYCEWAGKRLPTEAEWEKASRGEKGFIYPWGNEWMDGSCSSVLPGAQNMPCAAGAHSKGASPYGVMDMSGNVWEWAADWYDQSYYGNSPAQNPEGPVSGAYRVLRGGSWRSKFTNILRGAFRNKLEPESTFDDLGFRCAADLP